VSAISAPADRRFRRSHVKPSRRRPPWRTAVVTAVKAALVVVIAVYTGYRGSRVVASAPALDIDRIVVEGNARVTRGDVLAALDGLRGENIVLADLPSWRARLLAVRWVRDARLHRLLPSTIEVAIEERHPIGIARLDGVLYLVDEAGTVIDQYGPNYADLDLPIVDGLGAGAATVDGDRAALAARLIAALEPRPALARRLSQVDVTDPRNVGILLSGDPALLYVGADRFLARLQRYSELAAALREQVPDIDYVDLRFGDRIYVRPAGGTARAAAVRRR
jgi:cell division protein FtsQ